MKRAGKRPFPRRAVALAAAASTLWAVSQTADLGAAVQSLHAGGVLAEQILRLELEDTAEEDGLNSWTRLLVMETPALGERNEDSTPASSTDVEPATTDTETTASEADTSAVPADAEPPTDTKETPEEETTTPSKSDTKSDTKKQEAETPEADADTEPTETTLDLSAIKASQIDLDNHTSGIQINAGDYLNQSLALKLQPADKGPQILLLHTHATEAYTMDGEDIYEESDPARTTDDNYNMIRVGEEMKAVFEKMGLSVVHDTTTYDYPGYNGSYGRSLAGIQSYLEQYPTIQVVLDVHRDAIIASDGTAYAKTTTIDGKKVAQVMLVAGTNDGGLTHPDWKDNFAVAVRLQQAMLALDTTLPRPIDLRSQRFNQHLTPGSLLVEVGTSGNTLQEALAGARLFAQAAGQVYLDLVEQ